MCGINLESVVRIWKNIREIQENSKGVWNEYIRNVGEIYDNIREIFDRSKECSRSIERMI